jgi:hypothetical protein
MTTRSTTSTATVKVLEAVVVAYRMDGSWHAVAPSLDIWFSHDDLQEALKGVVEGAAAALALMAEEGALRRYLEARGFQLEGSAFRVPEGVWLKQVEELLREVREAEDGAEPDLEGLPRERCRIHTIELEAPALGS